MKEQKRASPDRASPRAENGNSREEGPSRRIIHVDMDAFYAQIEQRDFPEKYAGRPIAVGGPPPHGVVKTASYEARPYGIHSAQSSSEARRKCPDLIFVPARMDVYREVSKTIREIFDRYTDLVEPLSLDEAYLDVTHPKKGPPSGTVLAHHIRKDIRVATGLTASAGVGPNKFVAKMASSHDKPDGLTVIRPNDQLAFLADLPIEAFHGIGPVTAEKMRGLGIGAGADLQQMAVRELQYHFGKRGRFFKKMAAGRDDRPVEPDRQRKSVGAEKTYTEHLTDPDAMLDRLESIAERVAARLQSAGRDGRTVTLKFKTDRHETSTRQQTLDRTVSTPNELMIFAERLLHRPAPPRRPVRLLGLTVSSLSPGRAAEAGEQLVLDFQAG